jgi:L-lactate utilization protein LutC
VRKPKKKKKAKKTGRTMINDPLAADLANEANKNLHTDHERQRIEEMKNGTSSPLIHLEASEESDFEAKLNNLKGTFPC